MRSIKLPRKSKAAICKSKAAHRQVAFGTHGHAISMTTLCKPVSQIFSVAIGGSGAAWFCFVFPNASVEAPASSRGRAIPPGYK
jgi:hypothetical protein